MPDQPELPTAADTDPEDTVTVDEQPEQPTVDVEALTSENTVLRAIIARLGPDGFDVEAELDNVAFKRDGTPVWLGETAAPAEPPAPPPVRKLPRSTQRSSGSRRPNLKNMNTEELADHYQKVMQREWRAG